MSSPAPRSTRHSGAKLSDLVLPAPTVFARTPDSPAMSTPKPGAASSKKKKMKHVEKKKTYVEKKKREINNVFTEAKYAEDDAKWVADYGRSVAQWVMRSRKAAPPLLSAIKEKKVQQRRTDGSFPRPVGRAPSEHCESAASPGKSLLCKLRNIRWVRNLSDQPTPFPGWINIRGDGSLLHFF